jgi:hypothetical protein
MSTSRAPPRRASALTALREGARHPREALAPTIRTAASPRPGCRSNGGRAKARPLCEKASRSAKGRWDRSSERESLKKRPAGRQDHAAAAGCSSVRRDIRAMGPGVQRSSRSRMADASSLAYGGRRSEFVRTRSGRQSRSARPPGVTAVGGVLISTPSFGSPSWCRHPLELTARGPADDVDAGVPSLVLLRA